MGTSNAVARDMRENCYNIHNACRVRFSTDSEFLSHYGGRFLQGFESEPSDGPFDVVSEFHSTPWGAILDEFRKSGGAIISDNAWLKDGVLMMVRRGTLYRACYDGGCLTITGWFPEPKVLRYVSEVRRKWSRRLGMWESTSREEYHLQTVRDLLHFPIFSCLRKKGYSILHGSCVSKDGKAISLFGYNRVGKSSIALALMAHHGWNPVADNFILTDGRSIFAFPERLRYSKSTLDLAGVSNLSVEGKRECWGKYHFDLDELGRAVEAVVEPVLSCYVVRGDRVPSIRDLAAEEAVNRMGAMNAYLHEFDNFSFLNLLPGYFSFEDPEILKRIFSRAKVVELVAGKSVRETAQAVVDLLP